VWLIRSSLDLNRRISFGVIPAKAGIHGGMDPGFRRDDKLGDIANFGFKALSPVPLRWVGAR